MQPTQRPKAVIFDWDNTLVDSWPAIAEAINHVRHVMGYEPWSLEDVQKNGTRAARESFPQWFGDRWQEAYDIYYKGFDEIRRRRPLIFLNGAPELLTWLNVNNIPAFLVSNKLGTYLRIEVEKANWNDMFAGIAGAQDAVKDKPAREHVDHVLQDSGITAAPDVWFVGDSETDMLCGRNADCTPILIGKHWMRKTEYNAAYACADCAALLNWLKAIDG